MSLADTHSRARANTRRLVAGHSQDTGPDIAADPVHVSVRPPQQPLHPIRA